MAREFFWFLRDAAFRACAVLAACLPVRCWSRLDAHLPVTRSAGASAWLALLLSSFANIRAYLAYASIQASQAIDAMLQATGWRPTPGGAAPPAAAAATAQWVGSWLSPVTYIVATPVGALLTYLTLSSLARCVASAVGEPIGDPVLTAVDALVRRVRERGAVRVARARRERLEGADEPDLVVSGSSLGCPAADLIVIAVRQKPDWDVGVTVITARGWFQVGTPVERATSQGVRTIYPLTAVHGEVVLRRRVAYDLPVAVTSSSEPAPRR